MLAFSRTSCKWSQSVWTQLSGLFYSASRFELHLGYSGASMVAQMVKCLPATWETQVWSLGWEDALEKEMVPHSSTLAWKVPWTQEPGGLQSMGSQRVGHDWVTSYTRLQYIPIVVTSHCLWWLADQPFFIAEWYLLVWICYSLFIYMLIGTWDFPGFIDYE